MLSNMTDIRIRREHLWQHPLSQEVRHKLARFILTRTPTVAALWLEHDPRMTFDDLKLVLRSTATTGRISGIDGTEFDYYQDKNLVSDISRTTTILRNTFEQILRSPLATMEVLDLSCPDACPESCYLEDFLCKYETLTEENPTYDCKDTPIIEGVLSTANTFEQSSWLRIVYSAGNSSSLSVAAASGGTPTIDELAVYVCRKEFSTSLTTVDGKLYSSGSSDILQHSTVALTTADGGDYCGTLNFVVPFVDGELYLIHLESNFNGKYEAFVTCQSTLFQPETIECGKSVLGSTENKEDLLRDGSPEVILLQLI